MFCCEGEGAGCAGPNQAGQVGGAEIDAQPAEEKKYGFVPDKLVMDDLRSYAAAAHPIDSREVPEPATRSSTMLWPPSVQPIVSARACSGSFE
jgi:hypothetical protein